MHKPVEKIKSLSGLCKNIEKKEEEVQALENIGIEFIDKTVEEFVENEIKEVFNKHMQGKHAKTRPKVFHVILVEKNNETSTKFVEKLERKIVSSDFMELMSPWRLQQAIDQSM